MGMQQCLLGHLYDDSKSSVCPYCGNTSSNYDKNHVGIKDLFPEYKTISQIGKGGTGTVYRVEYIVKKAVKVIECGNDDSLFQNAKREFEFMQKASGCANVLNGYEMRIRETYTGKDVYILEEFAPSFFEYYRDYMPSLLEIKSILLDIAVAVKQLRNVGIVHLDIKPDNIFISDSGVAKLGDFSHMACVSECDSIDKIIGTQKYMAPEIFEKKEYNDTLEIYSLGIVMHCLLAREFPFDFSDRDLKIRRKDDTYVNCAIHSELMDIIKKATAYYPADRYSSIDEFIADITDVNFEKNTISRKLVLTEHGWENVYDMAFTCALPDCRHGVTSPVAQPCCSMDNAVTEFEKESWPRDQKSPKGKRKKLGIFQKFFEIRNKDKKTKFEEDSVQFSAAAPSVFKRNGYSLLKIMMHFDDDYERVNREIKKLNSNTVQNSSGVFGFNKGEKVRIVLQSPDIDIDDNVKEVIWNGIFAECTYSVFVPENYQKDQIVFKGRVYKGDAVLTDIILIAAIESKTEQLINVEKRMLKSAFISYASQDRAKVVARIQGILAARHDMDIFFDVESLRRGEKWELRLFKEIEKRSIFYLFWSHNASSSEWVKKELGYAIKVKGIDSVEPIPLEPPDVCPPPDELREKHFNDWTLRYSDK